MSTQSPQYQDEGTQRYGGESSGMWSTLPPSQGRRSKPFFLTSEFFVLLAAVLAVVIAAAVADNFDAPQAWTLVALLSAAYILSRGLAKIGSHGGGR